jgi:hypothetical protein
MRLIRHYTEHPHPPRYVKRLPNLPPAPPLPTRAAPRPSVVVPGARLRGVARWWSGIDAAKRWRRGIHRVDFYVDGRLLSTDRLWPYAFRGRPGWDTRTVANGRHMLSLRAHGRRGYRARRSIPVRVANPPMRLRIGGLADHDPVRGDVVLPVRPTGRVERIALQRPARRADDSRRGGELAGRAAVPVGAGAGAARPRRARLVRSRPKSATSEGRSTGLLGSP